MDTRFGVRRPIAKADRSTATAFRHLFFRPWNEAVRAVSLVGGHASANRRRRHEC